MSKNLDVLVAAHRIAAERRGAGKPVWERRINVRAILSADPDNESKEHAANVANQIGKLLRGSLPKSWLDITHADYDREIDDIIEQLEDLRPSDYDGDPDYSVLRCLNDALDELYDWADIARVWLG